MCALAEHLDDSLHLGDVTYGGGGSVNVDVIDILGLHIGILKGVLHREDSTETFGMCGGQMVCVCRHTASGNLSVNLGTTGLGMLKFLKDEDNRTLADYESVAAL